MHDEENDDQNNEFMHILKLEHELESSKYMVDLLERELILKNTFISEIEA